MDGIGYFEVFTVLKPGFKVSGSPGVNLLTP